MQVVHVKYAMDFTTDAILEGLYGQLAMHPEDNGPVASEGNIRLFHHPEVAAYIAMYREDGKLWAQIRIGYIYGAANVPARMRKNFARFITHPWHNPLTLPSGCQIHLDCVFVNDPNDREHRFGLDVIIDDLGFERCAELFDYLLTAAY